MTKRSPWRIVLELALAVCLCASFHQTLADPSRPVFRLDELSVRQTPARLRFELVFPGAGSAATPLVLTGPGQKLDLAGVKAGSLIGRVKLATDGQPKFSFRIHVVSCDSADDCRLVIFPDQIGHANQAVGTGRIRNTGEEFELQIQAIDWVRTVAASGALDSMARDRFQRPGNSIWRATFEITPPLRRPNRGDSRFRVTGAVLDQRGLSRDASPAEIVVSRSR